MGCPAIPAPADQPTPGPSFRPIRRRPPFPTLNTVVTDTLRTLVAEPRAPGAPPPGRRDAVLVAVVTGAAVVEAAARPDLVWRPLSLVLVIALACTLPWRRTRPFPVVAVAFATVSTSEAVAQVLGVEWEGLGTAIFLLLLPYALTRWGSGREVTGGLAVLAVPVALSATGGEPIADVLGGAVVLLLALTLCAGARYRRESRRRELEGMRARERGELARELHDTVAHHVSAIAVQAQAGRAVAGTHPEAAADALTIIEEEASRTLEEMRSMVGALRRDGAALAPQQGLADIGRLARPGGGEPRVEVDVRGELDGLRPSVDAALYRLAQEAVTNALRHARQATVVRVEVCGGHDGVQLTVEDDGRGGVGAGAASGCGLVGMAERAKLLGGALEAGPQPGGGWRVVAVLPRQGPAA
jgi:signal transduction histidine kinase